MLDITDVDLLINLYLFITHLMKNLLYHPFLYMLTLQLLYVAWLC